MTISWNRSKGGSGYLPPGGDVYSRCWTVAEFRCWIRRPTEKEWPNARGQKPGCGFTTAQLVGLFYRVKCPAIESAISGGRADGSDFKPECVG
jgi:hypothetical protein